MAFVVSREEHGLTESEVISFVAKMVSTRNASFNTPLFHVTACKDAQNACLEIFCEASNIINPKP